MTLSKKIYSYWMRFVRILGLINGTIIFTVVYFIVIGIYGLIIRIKGLLSKEHAHASSYWQANQREKITLDDMTRQF